ncbi:MAG: glycoside hydrolase family 16 protein [Kineosporiaceae bacterium]
MRTRSPRTSRPRVARVLSALGAALALPAAGLVALSAGSATASLPAASASWTTIWSEDFDGAAGSRPDSSRWQYDLGHCYPGCPATNWGTGEIEEMTDSTDNVALDGRGNLAITPLRRSDGSWTSGRIESRRTDLEPPAGGLLRIEGRIKQPDVTGAAAQGYWPAFWTLGAPFRGVSTNWPSAGEIDILEAVNGTPTVYGTLHCGVNPGGPCNETSGLGGSTPCTTCGTAFHTYAMELDRSTSPQQIRWYLDGVLYHSVHSDQMDAATWTNATGHGFFVILNVAIGGGWPGAPTASTVPGKPMLVDYVVASTRPGGGPSPTSTSPTPTPTGTDPALTSTTLYLRSGGVLSPSGGAGAARVTLPSAGGVTSDGTPRNAVTWTRCGIWGTPTGTASTPFALFVDSGTAVGNAVQARVSYDPSGTGSWSWTQTFAYFPTDPVAGDENYTQGQGLKASTGTPTAMRGGCVKLELWAALGTAPVSVRVDASDAEGWQSNLVLPISLGTPTSATPKTATPTTTARTSTTTTTTTTKRTKTKRTPTITTRTCRTQKKNGAVTCKKTSKIPCGDAARGSAVPLCRPPAARHD